MFCFLKFFIAQTRDYFGVSVAIMLGGANSGQTSIKWFDLACDVESRPLKNCKDLTVKLEVKHPFPTSSWGTHFYIYQLPEGLRMRKILAHMVLGCKRIHKPGLTFSAFLQIEITQVQSPTYPCTEISSMVPLTPKLSTWKYLCYSTQTTMIS